MDGIVALEVVQNEVNLNMQDLHNIYKLARKYLQCVSDALNSAAQRLWAELTRFVKCV